MKAQQHNTLRSVRVTAKKEKNIAVAPAPVQVISSVDLEKRNSSSVADAVKQFAGVQVKDYGGLGGLKTVSVRSLGANHTGVMYDGLLLGDAQGGQADLGKFSLDNVQSIQLSNAGPGEILLPARAFASASLLAINTTSANPSSSSKEKARFGFRFGSFGLLSPHIAFNTTPGKRFSTGISGTYQQAHGNYRFNSYAEPGKMDKRTNAAIKALRVEYDAAYHINDSNKLVFKTYYYQSERGLPGAIILYNAGQSGQELRDENVFVQGKAEKTIGAKNRLLVSAKYSADNYVYTDPYYPNSFGKLKNAFHQREIYVSGAYRYKVNDAWALSISSDVYNSRLRRSDFLAQGFADPHRTGFLNNFAFRYIKPYAEVTGNLLFSVLNERTSHGIAGRNLQRVTPALAVSIAPFVDIPLRFRAFYKRIFRAPTFNDLYYTNIGNTALRPEDADQYNAGFSFGSGSPAFIKKIILTADAYLNNVKDKILAVPRQNLFQWSMQNVGNVRIKGADVALHMDLKTFKNISISSAVSYSLQEALDLSDKASILYNTQLPYTPKHTGSLHLDATYKSVVFSYNLLFSSYRYRAGEAIDENLVQGWNSNDLSLAYSFMNKNNAQYRIIAEANNIFNTPYEIIKYFPMPLFNYRLSFLISLKNITK